jgi:uncharacterized protein (TIGR02246 family)
MFLFAERSRQRPRSFCSRHADDRRTENAGGYETINDDHEEESSMQSFAYIFESAAAFLVVAILSGGPAAAQHLTEQDGRQIIDGIEKVKAKAFETKDAALWGSLFADNSVQLSETGESRVGRPAIESSFGGLMKGWVAEPNKLGEVKVVNDKMIIYTGGWSGAWRDDKGSTQFNGHYSDAVVREDGGWKIVLDTISVMPPK